jgi:FtsH-binding integral membrane protein
MNVVQRLGAWAVRGGSKMAATMVGAQAGRPWNKKWRLSSAVDEHRSGYISQLREELTSLETVASDTQQQLIKNVLESQPTLTLAEAFRLEAALVSFLPLSVLRRRAWIIRALFADIAGERRQKLYEGSKPPDPATATEDELRADLSQLLGALERVSLTSELEDHVRRRFFRRVRTTALVALAVLLVMTAVGVYFQQPRAVPTLWVVLLAGMVGACFSAQQRLQSASPEGDVQTRVQALVRLAEGFYFAPIGGAIGALVLFGLFAGRLVQGDLFPIIDATFPAGVKVHAVYEFLNSAEPDSPGGLAKLLVWSFIAGFSERLVPSALDQLGGRLKTVGADQGTSAKGAS